MIKNYKRKILISSAIILFLWGIMWGLLSIFHFKYAWLSGIGIIEWNIGIPALISLIIGIFIYFKARQFKFKEGIDDFSNTSYPAMLLFIAYLACIGFCAEGNDGRKTIMYAIGIYALGLGILAFMLHKGLIYRYKMEYQKDSKIKVLGVTFDGVEDIIKHARDGVDKSGVWVAEDSQLYPCFDCEDTLYENRRFWNFVFSKDKNDLNNRLAALRGLRPKADNYSKLTEDLRPIGYWGGDSQYPVIILS